MNVVIQCAALKDREAGYWRTKDGRTVCFVAHPAPAADSEEVIYAKPDDLSEDGVSWRSLVLRYNTTPGQNPFKLYPAYRLYRNSVYRALVTRYGANKTYILSAGWGLIRSDFLTPYYNITLSASAAKEYHRGKPDHYNDFCMLPDDGEPVIFFAGKDYLPLFSSLTKGIKGERTIFYNSKYSPTLAGCMFRRYNSRTKTNWHYKCAKAFLAGELE